MKRQAHHSCRRNSAAAAGFIFLLVGGIFFSRGSQFKPIPAMRIDQLRGWDTVSFPSCLGPGVYSLSAWVYDDSAHFHRAMGGAVKVCPDQGDLNADGVVNAVDVAILINVVYRSNP